MQATQKGLVKKNIYIYENLLGAEKKKSKSV